ncbi:hypothetical protein [Streptomyces sp. NPDC002763]|uniref:hypothetical protein n=1 Tax=Streptomyces sp. NPDC002763 TaxID=3154427 RepID=UPI00331934AA
MTPSLLETRYRTVLRILPAYYRREREEEMVETYLCDIDRDTQDQSRPALGEVASIAALAVRSRLGAAGSPRSYEVLGSAVRLFALSAVLVQAAAAVVDDTLDLTSSTTRGPTQRHWFFAQFTDQGLLHGAVAAAQWTLPLLWAVAYFALLHDRRRLARTGALLAALPTLWPLAVPLMDEPARPDPAFATASGLLAWLSALALCAAYHRDAPPARLPAGSPGLVFLACCVVMGACNVLVPTVTDLAWTPATGFLAGGVAWLLLRTRRPGSGTPGGALALAALGLLLLGVRAASLALWIGVPVPAEFLRGGLAQTAALALLTAALAIVGGRDLAVRR